MKREEYIHNILQTYSLVSVLSEKNGGQVLRLRNKTVGKDMILRSYPARFDAYNRLCSILCENLPEIYDVLDLDDGQIVLEEFVNGITVAQMLETEHYRYRGAKKVLLGVCNAMAALHAHKIVHRDIKPENVMVAGNRVVLIDLNASRIISDAPKDTVVMGTVGYASPEQLGLAQSDARTDIYAVGVLMNVMLTGKHPTETFASGHAGKIIRKCTALNPDDRFQTALKLLESL